MNFLASAGRNSYRLPYISSLTMKRSASTGGNGTSKRPKLSEPTEPPTFDEVLSAYGRIKDVVTHTPVMTCSTLDEMSGRKLFFKCENLQKVGAFKFRGASNAVMMLSEEDAKKGVATHSSGNHAQALALAARTRGIPAHIVMPTSAPAVKKAAVLGYGAEVYPCAPTLEARETTAAEVIGKTGATFVHPYNNRNVIAGQASIALELLREDMKEPLDALIVPVGGGGMLSGICIAAKALQPNIRIFAAEPSGADDCKRSFDAKELVPQTGPNTIADGLLTSLGSLTWPIIRDNVEQVVTVDDDEIIAAMRLVWERMKLVIEPSAAVGVAVALKDDFKKLENIERVGIVLCGGNIDLSKDLPWKK